jgi:pimeloyl-ACP methyl ester carboxylesterase
MNYTESYKTLGSSFKPEAMELTLPELKLQISQFGFSSVIPDSNIMSNSGSPSESMPEMVDDGQIPENLKFNYPVIYPTGKSEFDHAVILLHGLNERSWTKYLPWAARLAEDLQRPVILFPISFHINRSPAAWSNPRLMSALLPKTRLRNRRNRSATFANLALSMRLSQSPLRFFTSGSQSLGDLESLATSIKAGNHPKLKKGTTIDIFAYSIGAFLAQIIMLTYGDMLFSDSRLFMFCGGAPFNRMNGVSKLIMDEEAFIKLRFYYLRQFDREIKSKGPLAGMINNQKSGQAFRAMIDSNSFIKWRKDSFLKMAERIRTVGLKKDLVIPPSGISEILDFSQIEELDFPYAYSHENPFPVNDDRRLVDQGFDQVFRRAVAFLR